MTRHTLLGNRDSDKILGDFEGLDRRKLLGSMVLRTWVKAPLIMDVRASQSAMMM